VNKQFFKFSPPYYYSGTTCGKGREQKALYQIQNSTIFIALINNMITYNYQNVVDEDLME